VGFFDQARSATSQLYSAFAIAANRLRDSYVFGKVFDPEVAKHYGVEQDSIVAFKQFDEGKVVYQGSSKTKELEDWIRTNSVALVGRLTQDNLDVYVRRNLPIAKLFLSIDRSTNKKQFDYYLNRMRKAAERFRNQIAVVWAKMEDFDYEVSQFGFKGKEFGLIIEKNYDAKYKYEGKFSLDGVIDFFQKFSDGQLAKWVRSEDVPEEEWEPGQVKVVVGKTFDEVVNDPDKDVLIEFYAPWCGHCKALEPKYKEVAAKLKNYSDVVVAKMDATANDWPRDKFEVSGYPTIYFVPAKEGARPVKYDGGRDVDEIVKFVKKRAKTIKKERKSKKKAAEEHDEL